MHTHTRLAGAACPLPRQLAKAAHEMAARARLSRPRAAVRVCWQVYVALACMLHITPHHPSACTHTCLLTYVCNTCVYMQHITTSHNITHLPAHIRACLHMYATLAHTCNTSHHTTPRPAKSAPCTLSRIPRGGQADVFQREPVAGARRARRARRRSAPSRTSPRFAKARTRPGCAYPSLRPLTRRSDGDVT